jgi:hypothetical protein
MLNRFRKSILTLLALGILASAETIPAGTRITVRTDSQISSRSARAGDRFNANLARDLVVDGKTIAKKGTPVRSRSTIRQCPSQPAAFMPRARATPRAT